MLSIAFRTTPAFGLYAVLSICLMSLSGCAKPTGSVQPSEPVSFAHLTDESFATELNEQSGTVLVDFYADWCGPCKAQAAILARMAPQLQDVKIVKVDVDACPKLSKQFKVTAIPRLIVFQNGSKVAEHEGMMDEAGIRKLLKSSQAVK